MTVPVYQDTREFDSWEDFLTINKEIADLYRYQSYYTTMTLAEIAEKVHNLGAARYRIQLNNIGANIVRSLKHDPSLLTLDDYATACIWHRIKEEGGITDPLSLTKNKPQQDMILHPLHFLYLLDVYSKPVPVIIYSIIPLFYDTVNSHNKWFKPGKLIKGKYVFEDSEGVVVKQKPFIHMLLEGDCNDNNAHGTYAEGELLSQFRFANERIYFRDNLWLTKIRDRWVIAEPI